MSSTSTYQKANTDWFADCAVGLSTHWTAQSMPQKGAACAFTEAVNLFRMNEFLNAVETSGVDYVIFTLTHALQMLPCPHPVIDSILPGRTTERDLIGEMRQYSMSRAFIGRWTNLQKISYESYYPSNNPRKSRSTCLLA